MFILPYQIIIVDLPMDICHNGIPGTVFHRSVARSELHGRALQKREKERQTGAKNNGYGK